MRNFTDREIIEGIRKGRDKEIVKSLYDSVLPNIRKYVCSNNGNYEDAFDVFQDALLIFFKLVATEKFDADKYKVHGFIHTVCKNLWINQSKRKTHSLNWEKRKEKEELDPTVLETLISEERKTALKTAFQSLGEKCVEILTLFFYQKLSLREIAEKLGNTTEEAVKVKSHRCRKMLGEIVKSNKLLMESLRN